MRWKWPTQQAAGPSRALPCALLFAGVGTGLQLGANWLREYRLRRFLEETSGGELIAKPEVEVTKPEVKVVRPEAESWKFPEWFPIQVLDEKAAAKRKAEQEAEFRGRVDSLHEGGRQWLPNSAHYSCCQMDPHAWPWSSALEEDSMHKFHDFVCLDIA